MSLNSSLCITVIEPPGDRPILPLDILGEELNDAFVTVINSPLSTISLILSPFLLPPNIFMPCVGVFGDLQGTNTGGVLFSNEFLDMDCTLLADEKGSSSRLISLLEDIRRFGVS